MAFQTSISLLRAWIKNYVWIYRGSILITYGNCTAVVSFTLTRKTTMNDSSRAMTFKLFNWIESKIAPTLTDGKTKVPTPAIFVTKRMPVYNIDSWQEDPNVQSRWFETNDTHVTFSLYIIHTIMLVQQENARMKSMQCAKKRSSGIKSDLCWPIRRM